MIRLLITIILQFSIFSLFGQSNEEKALTQGREAIKIMDEGKYDESIKLLEGSQKLDPDNYIYPYEIAYAYILKKDYQKAIKVLKKVKKLKNINSQVYQMSGNCYSYLGKSKEAIKEYEEGMKYFPNSGNLHLEKGNVFLGQKNYDEAIKNYEKGIKVDPTFPSNYFRLAKLFLNSTDKLSGLMYGEIFMNLERTTARTQEMSELLFNTYKSSITLGEKESGIDFCEIVLDASNLIDSEDLKLPFCAIFGKNFALSIIDEKEINLQSLSSIRRKFIDLFFQEDYKGYDNVLLRYHKEMIENDHFDSYNYYLFQIANQEEFNSWYKDHEEEFNSFVEWYVKDENIISITTKNLFLR